MISNNNYEHNSDTSINNLFCEIENCEKQFKKTKQMCIEYINNFYLIIEFELHNFDINNSLYQSIKPRKLIIDICESIWKSCIVGETSLTFNLQYSNPKKNTSRPGSPLDYLSEDDHKWFNNIGFRTKNIMGCFYASKNCEYQCRGDGICYIFIDFSNINNSVEYENKFNAKSCHEISLIVQKIKKIKY